MVSAARRADLPALAHYGLCAAGGVFALLFCAMLLTRAVTGGDAPAAAPLPEALQGRPAGELEARFRDTARALRDAPLDAQALLGLGRIAAAQGRTALAEQFKLAAAAAEPRVPAIQAEAMAVLLRQGDVAGLMPRLDGLLRANPGRAPELFAVLAGLAADDAARRVVAGSLVQAPPWRNDLIRHLLKDKASPDLAYGLLSETRKQGGSIATDELAMIISAYLRRGEVDRAYFAWLNSLSADELKDVHLVYDGGFEHPVRGLTFDWTVTPARGFSYRIFPRNTASMDMMLQIDFAGFTGRFRNLSQMLRLVPGRYRLSGDVRGEELQTAEGLAFRLSCAGTGGQAIAAVRLPSVSQWIDFATDFEVPRNGCGLQFLRLESAGATGEDRTMGRIDLDNIVIDRLPALAQ